MLNCLPNSSTDRPDPVPALLRYLESGNDVLRTGAVRAIAACAPGDERARKALLEALLDEDPDVRTDAMAALVSFARIEDAKKIRESLQGDPVREVKLAAIALLANLDDQASVPVLRKIVASRDEDNIAWEDETGMWDEWLDVQKAAVDALGALKDEDSIPDLLAARDDEFGQNLDTQVFRALANMNAEGLLWLLSVAKTEGGQARKRALEALGKIDLETLLDHLEFLLGDDAPEVRRLALPLLTPDDDRVTYVTLNDADAGVRLAALMQFGPKRAELATASLADVDEAVQAAAVGFLQLPLDAEIQESLIQNMRAWIEVSGGALAAASASLWLDLAPEQDAEPLLNLARNVTRPLEARIAAVNALARIADSVATERMISLLGNEAQQVRTVALTHLVAFATAGDPIAALALAQAVEGALLAPDLAVVTRDKDADGPDLAAPKGDDISTPRLRISPEGEVISMTDQAATPGRSTLEAIQIDRVQQDASPDDTGVAEDTPEETGAKRRKRRAVEGPDTVAQDLARVALGVAARVPGEAMDAAISVACTSADDMLRLAGYRALLERSLSSGPTEAARQKASVGLGDQLTGIRSVAAEIAALDDGLAGELAALSNDSDAMVRAVVVRSVADIQTLPNYLADPAQIVRRAALSRMLKDPDPTFALRIFDTLLAAERIDTLIDAVHASPQIMNQALHMLSNETLSSRQVHVLLQGLASDAVVAAPVQS